MRGLRVPVVSAVAATALGVLLLALPPMGSDLSAQTARADFFAAHGPALVDLRWYGGIHPFGYSLVSPPVMALLGVGVTGVLALVGSAAAFSLLLVRTGVPRPWLGSLVGVVCIAGNLVSGRVTYALGVAFGLLALLALTLPAPRGPRTLPAPRGPRTLPAPRGPGTRWRAVLAVAAALLAAATSPVAGLFVGLVGAALVLTRRHLDGLLLGVPAALVLGLTGLLFGEGGWMNISRTDTIHAVTTSLLVAALAGYRPVRVGALLSAAGVLAAALVHTPVGLNATRLVVMFGLPALAATARPPRQVLGWAAALRSSRPGRDTSSRRADRPQPAQRRHRELPRPVGAVALAGLLAVVCWWQPPVVTADLRGAGHPTSDPAFFAPLRAQLTQRGLTGRVEVPPTRDYWEAAHLGAVPLARGWLRQADIDRNPLFFTTVPGATGTGVRLDADSYRSWLTENAVQYVAVPETELSWVGRAEATLVGTGLPYLTEVWSDARWRLYQVRDPAPLVGAPAELLSLDATTVTFRSDAAGDVPVRVRYSRWLGATGGATVARDGDWARVTVPGPGRYQLRSRDLPLVP
ncbi:hypothetical protein [Micromonospora cathayae]|uniref:4-amino-4-deoxy-L-arabinose transferase n=1 Tax=Micromonospora cathayae TaxID=3028804 RepID=A0ABY7ZPX0_9ACTN|nr:hypothetical protein [Micromonospora sp. HUAS 3]WDZ84476.1 hypothetical protein PVK37_29245 [Micromonospora sp. HUAS 3]